MVLFVEMQFNSCILALVQTSLHTAASDMEALNSEESNHMTKLEEKELKRRQRRYKSSKRELIIYDTTRKETLLVKFFQKIVGIKINYRHILTMVKDAVYIHELEGMACILKLDL